MKATAHASSGRFVVASDRRWVVTPLGLALVALAVADLTFAVDSVSAAFGITTDFVVIWVANALALAGLVPLLALVRARRAEAARVEDEHSIARRRQQRRDIGVAVDVVRPAVEQEGRWTVGGTEVDVADVQETGLDLLHGAEGRRGGGCLWGGLDGHATLPTLAAEPTDATASRITSVTA
jgi:membrane protein implicated in regulation of membrane protease activity